jgi:sulfur-oxidizing protein SoxB
MVTNAGTNGKFVGMMDFDIGEGEVKGMQYHLVPVFENLLKPDPEMNAFLSEMLIGNRPRFLGVTRSRENVSCCRLGGCRTPS